MPLWVIAIELGIAALSLWAAHKFKAGETAAPIPQTAAIPRAEEGTPLPLAYGTVRIRSPLVVAVGKSYPRAYGVGGQTVYDYQLGMRMVLCRGNARVGDTSGASLIGMYAGDRRLETVFGPGFFAPDATGSGSYRVSDHFVYAEAPGAISLPTIGDLIFYAGRWDQDVHAADRIDDDEVDAYRIPYRGQVVVSLVGGFTGGWRTGGSTSILPYGFVIHNPVTIPGYEAVTAPIGDGDANPAAVLYDLLNHPWGSLGNAAASIDVDSFGAVAATLRDEGHGISIVIASATEARAAINEILKQIDGVMYEDPATRKYVLRLVRDDYDVGDLYIADPNTVVGDPELSSTLWDETYNDVQIVYTDAARDFADTTASAQDAANINTQGGRRRRIEYRYPGVSNAALAAKLAARELRFTSQPLMKLGVKLKRSAVDLRPGDPIRFMWPAWGVDAVFRIYDPDSGTLDDGSITVTAIQDHFSVPGAVFPLPAGATSIPPTPTPIALRTITEAPRWIAQKAYDLGFISNVDGPHGLYAAAPPTSQESRYRVMLDGSADTPSRAYPGRFVLTANYARHHGPFDATGFAVDSVEDWTPSSTTDAMIAAEGVNLALIDRELIAFRTATDDGGGNWTLSNVWRGVLDTVPADHVTGTIGYVLPGRFGISAMGSNVLTHGTTYSAVTLSAVGSSWTPDAAAPTDDLLVTSRTLRPYAPDAVEVNASQQPAALTEEGVTIEGTARDRLRGAITRPDAGAEAIEAGTTYAAVAFAEGENPLDGGVKTTLDVGYDDASIALGVGPFGLGAAGHGAIEVGLEGRRTVTLPDATSAALTSWQPATVPIVAHHYRNLLINPRFAVSGQAWTFTTGTPSYTSGSAGLGGGGTYLTTTSATLDGYQDVLISGYRPGGYRALLRFAVGPSTGDSDDTISVIVTSRDSGGTTLDTATYSATHPTTWQWQTLEISSLNASTASIRVRVVMAAVGELDTAANVAITECRLQVGQLTGQLLANPSFESTITTGWTESVGTWQQLTSPIYGSANFARPNNGASAQLYQDVTPTAGWESSAVAVLELGRMNDDASDTGTVTLQARDSGGTVLASSTTGAEAISPTNVWQRRILFLELPSTTATVRVVLDATRVAGTPLNSCFDDLDLRIHSHLASDESLTLDFSAERHTQALPATRFEWTRDFPTVPIPNHGILAGAVVGGLGTEPLIETTGAAFMGARCVIDQGSNGMTSTGYEIPGNGTGTSGDGIQVAPVGSSFANFGKTADWAGLIVARWSATTAPGSTVALASRYDAGKGWRLDLNTSGVPVLRVEDGATAATATATDAVAHGDWFVVGIHYGATTGYLSIIDRSGTSTVDVATFGVADWLHSDAIRFQLGSSAAGLATFPGQIARVYLWRSTVPTTAQLASCITTHTRPSAWGSLTYSRTQTIAVPTGSDSTGVLVERFSPARVATGGTGTVYDRRGLVVAPQLAAVASTTFTGWASAGGTITDAVAVDPTGLKVACTIAGTSSQGRYVAKTLGSAGAIYVRIMVRADAAGTVRIGLDDSGGTSQASAPYSTTTEWTVITASLAWTGATSGAGRLRISGSTSGTAGTVYLSPLVYVGAEHPGPGWPLGGTSSACYATADASALTVRLNHAGEIVADTIDASGAFEGVMVRLHNGTNANDSRTLAAITGPDTSGAVLDSGGAGSSVSVFNDDLPTAAGTTARLRWNRAGLPDHASAFARVDRGADGFGAPYGADVRTATWSASSTVLDVLDLGHSGGSTVWGGVIERVTVRGRERKD